MPSELDRVRAHIIFLNSSYKSMRTEDEGITRVHNREGGTLVYNKIMVLSDIMF